ncbi:MAG: signal peptide peptidase SppA [Planctomycetota bacterium]|nr:signal peptide peptidase SppA [Planctomycetota bacterium]
MNHRLMRLITAASTIWLAGGCAPTGFKIMPIPVDRTLKEQELLRDPGWVSDKIALIDVDGVIVNRHSGRMFSEGEHPVSLLLEKLAAAQRDPAVKAVVLRINSPGGSVTASALMHEEITRFKKTGKPVVAMMMDVAASGGYYIACACDEIIAYPSTVTGSIGVIMQTVDLSGTLAKLGVSTDAITSGPRKGAGSPLQPMSAQDRAIFQAVIDEMFHRFVDVVDEGRPDLSRERIVELADGRIYTARQAHEAGLVDRIGNLRDAIKRAKELAGIERARVVTYQRPLSWHPNIYAQAPGTQSNGVSINLINLNWPSWLRPGEVQFMYLWSPG